MQTNFGAATGGVLAGSLQIVDRAISIGKVYVSYHGLEVVALVLQDVLDTFRYTVQAATDTIYVAQGAIKHGIWANAAGTAVARLGAMMTYWWGGGGGQLI